MKKCFKPFKQTGYPKVIKDFKLLKMFHLKALEKEFGTRLFDRVGKRIMMTPAGEVLYKHSRHVINDLQNAYDEIDELSHHEGGRLSVGVHPSDLDYRLPSLFIDFHNQFPDVNLRIVSTLEIAKLTLDSTIDVGIGVVPVQDRRLTVLPLYREEYGLVVSEQHEWAKRESVSISELKGLPMIVYPKGVFGRELIENVCRQHGFKLDTVVETMSNLSLFRFVAENFGATLNTSYLTKSIGVPGLQFIPIYDDSPCWNMGIVYRSDKYLTHAMKIFIKNVQRLLTQDSSK